VWLPGAPTATRAGGGGRAATLFDSACRSNGSREEPQEPEAPPVAAAKPMRVRIGGDEASEAGSEASSKSVQDWRSARALLRPAPTLRLRRARGCTYQLCPHIAASRGVQASGRRWRQGRGR
jgi:hypothetical protein